MFRVLIIEDNDDERRIYRSVLHYNGFEVSEATNGMEGVDLAKRTLPDAIVMDVRMPGLNGLLATEILKASPETERIPVVCVSGFDIEPGIALNAGCARLLRKPIGPVDLVGALRSALESTMEHPSP